jgi:hypothetical protein
VTAVNKFRWWKGNPVVSGRLRVVPGVVVEELGGNLMVMVPGLSGVLTLSGESARVLRQVQAGEAVVSHDAVSELIDRGVLQEKAMSRRGLIKAGAVGAGAGIAVMAMPGVAAAASVASASFTIFYYSSVSGRPDLYNLYIPVAQANFSSAANLQTGGPGGSIVGIASGGGQLELFGSTYWVFNSGARPADPEVPWTIVDGAPLSGPVVATALPVP